MVNIEDYFDNFCRMLTYHFSSEAIANYSWLHENKRTINNLFELVLLIGGSWLNLTDLKFWWTILRLMSAYLYLASLDLGTHNLNWSLYECMFNSFWMLIKFGTLKMDYCNVKIFNLNLKKIRFKTSAYWFDCLHSPSYSDAP